MNQFQNVPGPSQDSFQTLSDNLASVQDNLTAITTGPNVPSDLNSIDKTSICYTNNSTTNRPADWCIVYTFAYSATTKAQLAFCISSDNIYYRRYSSSTWQAWKKVTMTAV